MLPVQRCLKVKAKISQCDNNKAESILTPNLQLDLFAIDRNHSSSKFNANCEIVDRLEAFVGELQQQA